MQAAATTVRPDDVYPALPGAAYRRYALGLLTALYALNYLDREIINILAEPIRRELKLADWQLGAMSGLAFALFYSVMGIPVARLAERRHRPRLIALSVAAWSGFTLLCGSVASFAQMFLARVGVGIGEAGLSPAAHALIAGSVPRERRATALAIYSMGASIGSVLGLTLGGLIADAFGWRRAFLIAGAPGLLLAVLAWTTLREPRVADRPLRDAPAGPPSFGVVVGFLLANRSFRWIAAGAAVNAFVNYGHAPFVVSYFLRVHGDQVGMLARAVGAAVGYDLKPIGLIGLALGLGGSVAAILGTLAGGMLSDRLGARDARARLTPALAGSLLTIPLFAAAMLVGSVPLAMALIAVNGFVSLLWLAPAIACAQGIATPAMRATTAAVLLLVINLFGVALGPFVTGLVSDALAHAGGLGGGEGVRWAMIAMMACDLAAAWAYARARRTIAADIHG